MNTAPSTFLRAALVLLTLACTTVSLTASDKASRIKFSDPAKPGLLKLSLPWADVKITGTDGDEVVVTSTLAQKQTKHQIDKDGFRRLDDDVTFELNEKNNVVTLAIAGEHHWSSHGTEFTIQVPRNTNLIVRTQAGGNITIKNIDGDIDVNGMNGEISLTDIGSSAVVNTMNGEVVATFRRAPTKPVSITSMNGEIDLRLPADTKANLRLRTHNGSVRTNFGEDALVTKTVDLRGPSDATSPEAQEVALAVREALQTAREVVREVVREVSSEINRVSEEMDQVAPAAPAAPRITVRAPRAPKYPSHGGKSITGALNGGGVDISLSSMNGSITLRKTN
ncbi:MAG: hypothetical protein Q8M02_07230 [Candidatus Didemnitutus sp.]|nr:hypothetical protein [Candidatus Didemnitutus sp.]